MAIIVQLLFYFLPRPRMTSAVRIAPALIALSAMGSSWRGSSASTTYKSASAFSISGFQNLRTLRKQGPLFVRGSARPPLSPDSVAPLRGR